MAGAALFHSIVLNHAFHNGNKRTGLVALVVFLDKNGLTLTCSHEDLFRYTLRVAGHKIVKGNFRDMADRETLEIARWVAANSRRLDRREHCLKWLKLKQRLRDFGCTTEPAGGVGNRVNIMRPIMIEQRGFFGTRQVERVLKTQVASSGDGTDADKLTIKKIRRDLELDDEHGYDGAAFYTGLVLDSLIADYRSILRRLARL